MDLTDIAILIPAYKPDERLVALVSALEKQGYGKLVVVNDGSGPEFDGVFAALPPECAQLAHKANMGKGRAMKTGFEYLMGQPYAGVITADADGQHTPEDILAIARAFVQNPQSLVLGCRKFTGNVPFKSRAGNSITRTVFALAGVKVSDTQTGLRAMPVSHLEWMCRIPGNRYEFETAMLLKAKEHKLPFYEVEIETIYLDNNSGSHFHVVRDSLFIYGQILKFGASSLFAFFVDFLMLMLLERWTGLLLVSVVGARVISALTNYMINKKLVFRQRGLKSLGGYALTVVIVLACNYGLILLLTTLGVALFWAKLITEIALFFFSYNVQKWIVFRQKRSLN